MYRHCMQALKMVPSCAEVTRLLCSHFSGTLLVDGKYVRIGPLERKIPVIYGIDYATHDIVISLLSHAENFHTTHAFFRLLHLCHYPLQALVCDDNSNIYEACKHVYPSVVVQLCLNHYKEHIRENLSVRTDTTYVPFVHKIEELFAHRRGKDEFDFLARKIVMQYSTDSRLMSVMLDIEKRKDILCGYRNLPNVPLTTNLIESYNSHLEGRLKSIKGFESFSHAKQWLNAYFMYRRLKPLTDCEGKFKRLNGYASLQKTLTDKEQYNKLLNFFR